MQTRKETNIQELSAKETVIISELQLLEASSWHDYTHEIPDIPLEKILQICADVWQVDSTVFHSKTDHSDTLDKFRKKSFFWACKYFSNSLPWLCSRYINIRQPWQFGDLDWYIFKFPNKKLKYGSQLIKILSLLNEIRPERLRNLYKVSFDQITGVTDLSGKLGYKLRATTIARITLKSKDWFYNSNTQFTMIAHSLDGMVSKMIRFSRTSDHKLLYRMQKDGYRFLSHWDQVFMLSEQLLETTVSLSNEVEKLILQPDLSTELGIEANRETLIEASATDIRAHYGNCAISELQCELILWQESEHYEICQVIKELLDKKLANPKSEKS